MNILNTLVILYFIFITLGCQNKFESNQPKTDLDNQTNHQIKSISIGLLVFDSSKNIEEKKFVLLNKDNSVYLEVSFSDDKFIINNNKYNLYSLESDEEILKKHNFYPFSFYPETGEIIHFEVLEITENYYKVKINNDISDYKLISTENSIFKFKDWKTHMEESFIFPKDNLLYLKPSLDSKSINIEFNENSFELIEFLEGDWLKVKCFKECNGCSKFENQYFYLKWREGGNFLIDFNYIC